MMVITMYIVMEHDSQMDRSACGEVLYMDCPSFLALRMSEGFSMQRMLTCRISSRLAGHQTPREYYGDKSPCQERWNFPSRLLACLLNVPATCKYISGTELADSVACLLACLTSQQHASVSQGRNLQTRLVACLLA